MHAYNPAEDDKGKAIPPRKNADKNQPKPSHAGAVALIFILLMLAGFAFGSGLFVAEIVTYNIENKLFPIESYCPAPKVLTDAFSNSQK